jgi:hypothetical protein
MNRQTKLIQSIPVPNRPQDFLEVSVSYQMGGSNYFHGTDERRGYYLLVQLVTIEVRGAYIRRSFMVGTSGTKRLLEEATRFGAPKLERLAQAVTAAEYQPLVEYVANRLQVVL